MRSACQTAILAESDNHYLEIQVVRRDDIFEAELASRFSSPEGQDYFAAMQCGVTMSFANRQVILHRIREVFASVLGRSVDGQERSLLVHRKGATRAFGPYMADLPERYQDSGQPVIIGGSMETGSYLLVGIREGAQTFFSTAHGGGRTMSRNKARKQWREAPARYGQQRHVRAYRFVVRLSRGGKGCKGINDVIIAPNVAEMSKRVVRFRPLGNIKG